MDKIKENFFLIVALLTIITSPGFSEKKEEREEMFATFLERLFGLEDDYYENNKENSQIENIEKSEITENESKSDYEVVNDFAYVLNDTQIFDSDTEFKQIIGNTEKYQKVFRLETGDFYSLVQTEDLTTGFISNENLEVLPSVFVEVDLSDQTVNLYKEKEIILTSLIVTGSNNTPTHIGYFPISYKTYNTRLKGKTWNVHVDYWMPFDGSIGLHDAPWRNEFGGDIYANNGSHGCVNLPHETAKTIYETVEKGDKVLVHK